MLIFQNVFEICAVNTNTETLLKRACEFRLVKNSNVYFCFLRRVCNSPIIILLKARHAHQASIIHEINVMIYTDGYQHFQILVPRI